MGRTTAIVFGTGLAALGLGVVALSALFGLDIEPSASFGALLLVAGVVRLMTASSLDPMARTARRRRARTSTDGPAVSGPQLVGRRCVACDARITVALEAEPCSECGAATHHACLVPHRQHEHRPAAVGPFR